MCATHAYQRHLKHPLSTHTPQPLSPFCHPPLLILPHHKGLLCEPAQPWQVVAKDQCIYVQRYTSKYSFPFKDIQSTKREDPRDLRTFWIFRMHSSAGEPGDDRRFVGRRLLISSSVISSASYTPFLSLSLCWREELLKCAQLENRPCVPPPSPHRSM